MSVRRLAGALDLDAEQAAGAPVVPERQPLAQRPLPGHGQQLYRHEGEGKASVRQGAAESSRRRAEVGCRHAPPPGPSPAPAARRSAEHTSELQSLMRISYAVFCLKKK